MLNYDIFGASCETFANCSIMSNKETDRLSYCHQVVEK